MCRRWKRGRSGLWIPGEIGVRRPDRGVQVTITPGSGSGSTAYTLAVQDGLVGADAVVGTGGAVIANASDGLVAGDISAYLPGVGDIYEWVPPVIGQTNAQASGSLIDSHVNPFIGQGNPAWAQDFIEQYLGKNSVSLTLPVTVNNTGQGVYYLLPVSRTSLYCRVVVKYQSPFNLNAGNGRVFSRQSKTIRMIGPGFNKQLVSWFINTDPGVAVVKLLGPHFDSWKSGELDSARGGQVVFDFSLHQNEDIVLETFCDWTTPTAVVSKAWINSNLTHSYTDDLSATGPGVTNGGVLVTDKVGTFQFDGTINAMNSASKMWLKRLGLGTIQIGPPLN